ncbi:polyphenol oxidase family protein, partial [Citricoccus sp.]|uniref:polyphenol oxidase family protein n=1 Tax=Citricoccus sp. TaxID=1978372 RepID=UPI0028BDDAE4
AGPFLFRAHPDPGLEVAFTGVDAGNLAFHVSGTPAAGSTGDGGTAGADDGPGGPRERVRASRRGVEAALGVAPGRTEYLTQVHSARVVAAAGRGWDESPAAQEADAFVSPTGRDPLAIMVADCVPVVFASRRSVESPAAVGLSRVSDGRAGISGPGLGGAGHLNGPTAVAHAGRRGLLDGILQNTVERMRREGSGHEPGDILAWIGPAICGRCYEVPEQMRLDGAAQIPATHATTTWGTPALDLPAGAQAVLESLGVTVHRSPVCTREDPRLFSHRRDPGRGRFIGLVWRRQEGQGTGPDEGGEGSEGNEGSDGSEG